MIVALADPRPSHIVCSPYRPPVAQGVDQRRHDASTAGAQRMSDGDRTAVHIRLGQIRSGVMRPRHCQALRDPADRSITVGVKRYRTKTETHVYLYLSDRIERLIYSFPVRISSPIFRIGVWFSG